MNMLGPASTILFLLTASAVAQVAPAAPSWKKDVPRKPWLSSPRRTFTPPELPDASDEWIKRSFDWVDDMLSGFAPGIPEHPARRAALGRLDDVLHIESAPLRAR
jgi:hypothetical protein